MHNKEGKIKLETSAHYVPVGDTNIVFYDSDIGTADLIFYITRNQRPLEVSDENVDCFLMLKANDGTYIVDTAQVVDPLNGKVKYTVPKEFLRHTGNIKGQVWIAVHGKEDMVTEVEFNFSIKNSMISTIPSVDKLNYIRTFEDLRERIEDRVKYIEDSLANGDDYVTQMDDTFQSGMKSLNDRSKQVIEQVEKLADSHKEELTNLRDSSISDIDDKANQIKEDIEELNNYDTSNWQKYKLTNDDGSRIYISKESMNDKNVNDFDAGLYEIVSSDDPASQGLPKQFKSFIMQLDVTIGSNGRKQFTLNVSSQNKKLIKTIHGDIESKWKEITATNIRTWLGTIGEEDSGVKSVLELEPGFYECSIPPDAFEVDVPLDPNGSGYIATIDVYEGRDARKLIRLVSSHRNEEYHATVHTKNEDNPNGQFKGWKRVMNAEEFEGMNTDTGWIDWSTMNGATKRGTDEPESLQNQYRVIMTNGIKKLHLRINVNNIVTQNVFGKIPSEYVPKQQTFLARTPVYASPGVVLAETNGNLSFYANNLDKDSWKPAAYIMGEFSWIIDDTGSGI